MYTITNKETAIALAIVNITKEKSLLKRDLISLNEYFAETYGYIMALENLEILDKNDLEELHEKRLEAIMEEE